MNSTWKEEKLRKTKDKMTKPTGIMQYKTEFVGKTRESFHNYIDNDIYIVLLIRIGKTK